MITETLTIGADKVLWGNSTLIVSDHVFFQQDLFYQKPARIYVGVNMLVEGNIGNPDSNSDDYGGLCVEGDLNVKGQIAPPIINTNATDCNNLKEKEIRVIGQLIN
ncbi:hypothetical protein [Alkalicoccus daliensis]|uniref:Polymer-forming cytoskeletal protein n=1 Tax=Alkalicoccus daliensis TaxID=745820 RepID=A0A1H0IBL5_9BACI|nr:hypothetical protein [Alkalicoccus daliensis]SDO28491.1 hypothetical protein SAMN04488053_11071 [Alkalicoccus daliensis]